LALVVNAGVAKLDGQFGSRILGNPRQPNCRSEEFPSQTQATTWEPWVSVSLFILTMMHEREGLAMEIYYYCALNTE
jgi:hypothetical protein